MLLSASDVRAGILPGRRLPVHPYHDAAERLRRRRNHWRRFNLGQIETVTVTPPVSLAPDTITPTFDPGALVSTVPDIAAPVGVPLVAMTGTTAPTDWTGDFLKLAQIAGATTVGVIQAQHGLVPGVTGGIGVGPAVAGRLPGGLYPGTSQGNLLTSLLGGGGMSLTTMLLLSGVGLVAFLALARKK